MNESSRLVVHHLESSRSLRVLWLLEELGLPYEIQRYARDESFRAPPELSAVHPLELVNKFSGPAIATHFGFVEDELSTRPYFAGGELSAADIQMIYPVEAALARGRGNWPNLRAWRERVTARPAYQRAESRGGPAMPPPHQ